MNLQNGHPSEFMSQGGNGGYDRETGFNVGGGREESAMNAAVGGALWALYTALHVTLPAWCRN